MAEILDLEKWNQQEFGEGISETVRGFLASGETVRSTAEIMRLDPSAVKKICQIENVPIKKRSRRPGIPHTREHRAKIADTQRRRARERTSGYNVKRLTHEGENLSLAEWSERVGVERHTLNMRLRRGWTVENALNIPVRRHL